MTQNTTTDTALPLGKPLLYRKTFYVHAFGRERDEDGEMMYYWVVCGAGRRFKAFTNELEKV